MARGGSRPGAGRPRKGAEKATVEREIRTEAKARKLTPLEYMLEVMNDPSADDVRRDRMAQAAAAYVHAKPGEIAKGKKEERQEAAERAASGGRFATPSAPRLVADNSR